MLRPAGARRRRARRDWQRRQRDGVRCWKRDGVRRLHSRNTHKRKRGGCCFMTVHSVCAAPQRPSQCVSQNDRVWATPNSRSRPLEGVGDRASTPHERDDCDAHFFFWSTSVEIIEVSGLPAACCPDAACPQCYAHAAAACPVSLASCFVRYGHDLSRPTQRATARSVNPQCTSS